MKEKVEVDEWNYKYLRVCVRTFHKISKLIMFILAVILFVGGIGVFLFELIWAPEEHFSMFFGLMSNILLIAAAIHLSLALCFADLKSLKKQFIPAILMSAFAITLVLLHKGVAIFLYKEDNMYTWSDARLILFIVAGGTFMVATIYLLILKHELNKNEIEKKASNRIDTKADK